MKEYRKEELLSLLEEEQILKVTDISKKLNVTNMTVRRDLQELEDQGLLIRIHGGAKLLKKKPLSFSELSHLEKQQMNLEEKQQIAKLAAAQINDGDTVFIGSGTTLELVPDHLTIDHAKIITNSFHVFEKIKTDNRFEVVLIGGSYRSKTGAFVGTIANDFVETIYVKKAFIGVNGITNNAVFNSNEDEGLTQRYILDSADEKYIVADNSKFDRQDFYRFYQMDRIDCLITNASTSQKTLEKYRSITKIIQA